LSNSSPVPPGPSPAGPLQPTGRGGASDLAWPHRDTEPTALSALGWGPDFAAAFDAQDVEGAFPARVARVDRQALTVLSGSGELRVTVAPEIAHGRDPVLAPTVGDWVVVKLGSVVGVLARRSAIVRGSAGTGDKAQVLAANVDKVFVVCSLEGRFRPRRLERLLVLAWQSGAAPVVVLTKADIAEDLASALEAASRLIGTGEVVAVSSLTGAGMDEVCGFLEPGVTVALLGPSGAGKSTLANRLGLGTLQLATGEVRGDGKGRHTTTARELVCLPGGAMLIDTPGLRALALFEAEDAISIAFSEVEELAAGCRFADCAHESEPGCAIKQAIAEGTLDRQRFASFDKLRREQRHLAARVDPRERAEARKRYKALGKLARQSQKP
jgi:ribosome small subunit-dependent GTPase A